MNGGGGGEGEEAWKSGLVSVCSFSPTLGSSGFGL